MRNIPFFLLLILITCSAALAQKPSGIVRGVLLDTAGKQPLAGATVSLVFAKDCAMASYTVSDRSGSFEIKGLANDNYKLFSPQGITGYSETMAELKGVEEGEYNDRDR